MTAGAGIYLAVVFGAVNTLRDEVIDGASAATNESRRFNRAGTGYSNKHPWEDEGYDGRDEQARTQLTFDIAAICYRTQAYKHPIRVPEPDLDPTVPPVEDPAGRAEFLLGALSMLSRTYPLKSQTFGSIEEVALWLPVATGIVQQVDLYLEWSHGYADETVEELAKRKSEEAMRYGPREIRPGVIPDPGWSNVFAGYRSYIKDVRERVEDLESKFAHWKGYRERLPSRTFVLRIVLAVVVAFATGVALPLIDTDLPRIVYVGVPCVLYGAGLTWLCAWVAARYRKSWN